MRKEETLSRQLKVVDKLTDIFASDIDVNFINLSFEDSEINCQINNDYDFSIVSELLSIEDYEIQTFRIKSDVEDSKIDGGVIVVNKDSILNDVEYKYYVNYYFDDCIYEYYQSTEEFVCDLEAKGLLNKKFYALDIMCNPSHKNNFTFYFDKHKKFKDIMAVDFKFRNQLENSNILIDDFYRVGDAYYTLLLSVKWNSEKNELRYDESDINRFIERVKYSSINKYDTAVLSEMIKLASERFSYTVKKSEIDKLHMVVFSSKFNSIRQIYLSQHKYTDVLLTEILKKIRN